MDRQNIHIAGHHGAGWGRSIRSTSEAAPTSSYVARRSDLWGSASGTQVWSALAETLDYPKLGYVPVHSRAEVFKVWDCGPPLRQSLERGAKSHTFRLFYMICNIFFHFHSLSLPWNCLQPAWGGPPHTLKTHGLRCILEVRFFEPAPSGHLWHCILAKLFARMGAIWVQGEKCNSPTSQEVVFCPTCTCMIYHD